MKPAGLALIALGIPFVLLLVFSMRGKRGEAPSPPSPQPVAVQSTLKVPHPARKPLSVPAPASRPSLEQVLEIADDLLSGVFSPADSESEVAGRSLSNRDFPRALVGFDRLLVRQPNDPSLLLGKGMALAGLGRHEDALPLFENAVERDPGNAAASFDLSVTQARLGEVDAAAATLRALLERHPEHLRGRFNLATLLQARRQYREALTQWRGLTDATEGTTTRPSAPVDPIMRTHLVQAWSHRGECAMALDRADEARSSFQKVVELKPDARAWTNLGIAEAAGSWNREAKASLEQALKLDPKLIPALNQLAYLHATYYQETGDLDSRAKVLELCGRSLALEPAQGNLRQLRLALEHEGEEEEPPVVVEESSPADPGSSATRP